MEPSGPIPRLLGWLREPSAGRVAAIAAVVAAAMVVAIQAAVGGV